MVYPLIQLVEQLRVDGNMYENFFGKLTTTGTEESLGGVPESSATTTRCASVVLFSLKGSAMIRSPEGKM